jgi:hypothetical protein
MSMLIKVSIKLSVFLLLASFVSERSHAQVKVAQYSYGKYGTDNYEKFEFWTNEGKQSKISYSYGKKMHEVMVQYFGKGNIYGDTCFKIRFSNGYVLYIVPKDLRLKITDSIGRYNKTFTWEYEGPVNGVGTYCDVCADNDRDAMKTLLSEFIN